MNQIETHPMLRDLFLGIFVAIILAPFCAIADDIPSFNFGTPVFGLTSVEGNLLVADNGQGVVRFRKGEWKVIAELTGITDVSSNGQGNMFAVTGAGDGPNARRVFRVSHKGVDEIADLLDFETNVNPDGGLIDSNPF